MAREQARIALDSSYLIALLSSWHAQHPRTLGSYQHWSDRNAQIILPAHTILECYSVLTRLPAPYRLPPDIALQAMHENFSRTAVVVGVKGGGLWERIESFSRLKLGGGQVYDALIAWCAADAGATILLTWNLRHFATIAPPGLEVREP
jgi:predicted nucleic acid-binding protein